MAAAAPPGLKKTVTVLPEKCDATNGGAFIVLEAEAFGKVSKHTVIVNDDTLGELVEASGSANPCSRERLAKLSIRFLWSKGLKLDNTEGVIEGDVFPRNYFVTPRTLLYFYEDASEWLAKQIATDNESDGAEGAGRVAVDANSGNSGGE